MALLSKDQILTADDRRYAEVAVPEWDGSVRLRSLTGTERDRFEAGFQESKGKQAKDNMENFRARLVALCAVDEEGKLLFTNRQEVVLLGGKSVAALQRLFDKCNEMNGISEQDVEELVEDFDEAPAESSTSA